MVSFCFLFVSKFDNIKDSCKILTFLLASFGIVLLCFTILSVSALNFYIECKKIAVLKETLFDSEIIENVHSCNTKITRKSAQKDNYKAFASAVADL